MAKLIVFYSRAGENYFGGKYRTVPVGNTGKVARLLAEKTGADLLRLEQDAPDVDAVASRLLAVADLAPPVAAALVVLPSVLLYLHAQFG